MSKPSAFDEHRIQGIYDTLEGMHITLDSNPIIYGPKRLQEKVAAARNYLTGLEGIYLDVFRALKSSEDTFRREKLGFELEEKRLLAEDPEVRAERNIRDREARCHMKLRDAISRLNELEIQIANLQALIAILKTKRTDLKDVGSKLRDQMKLVHEEIGLGRVWGTAPAPGSATVALRPGQAGIIVDDPTDIIAQVDGEIHLGTVSGWEDPTESSQKEPEPEPEEEEPVLGLGAPEEVRLTAQTPPEPVLEPVEEEEAPLDLDIFDRVVDDDPEKIPPGDETISSDDLDSLLMALPEAPMPRQKATAPAAAVVTEDIDALIDMLSAGM